jgi:hypothetical protein
MMKFEINDQRRRQKDQKKKEPDEEGVTSEEVVEAKQNKYGSCCRKGQTGWKEKRKVGTG